METELPVKAYTKYELARLYNPGMCYRSAMRIFRSWLLLDGELHTRLLSTGYRHKQHQFTPRQVELIFDHLGRP